MKVFGIDEKDFFDKNLVKVVDSIAGAGKSTQTHMALSNVNYLRTTATNQLKKDAEEKFGIKCKTIASGLFENEDGRFYTDTKGVDFDTVVIDEILLSSSKVFDWIYENVGKVNIIITTDSHQMLAPENEKEMLSKFKELISKDFVIYKNVMKTYRARTKATEVMYNTLYNLSESNEFLTGAQLASMFKTETYENVAYNKTDTFICHTNNIEDKLYKDFKLSSDYSNDLITKGRISSRTIKDFTKYPILSQYKSQTTKSDAYLQVANLATPTRFQGSEVNVGNKLYYFVESTSHVTARELYTVCTRCMDIDDLVIVVIDNVAKHERIKTFHGKVVKKSEILTVESNEDTQTFSKKMMNEFLKKYDTDEVYYSRDVVYKKNSKVIAYKADSFKVPESSQKKSVTMSSLAKKDGDLNYTFMNDVYRCLDKSNIEYIRCPIPRARRAETKYQVDMYSAYQAVCNNCYVPVDCELSYEESSDKMNFYLYEGKVLSNRSLITDNLKTLVEQNNLGKCTYLFSTDKKTGCKVGEYLHNKAYESVESKQEIKGLHWGYFQKRFLSLSYDESCYVCSECNKYELFIVSIISELSYYMLQLREALNSDYIHVDAVHFDTFDDTIVSKIRSILPSFFDFRIVCNEDKSIVYKSYEDLKTKEEIRREKRAESQRQRRAKMREEKSKSN